MLDGLCGKKKSLFLLYVAIHVREHISPQEEKA